MRNDDVIKSIRYILDLPDATIAEILKSAGYQPKRSEIEFIFDESWPDGEKPDTTHELTAHFLDGLIYHRRGKSDKHPPRPITVPITNNVVLKKLRVAFKLREEDILRLIKKGGFEMSSSEVNALFRKPKSRNYKKCGDQVLRYFLKGLAKTHRK
jgi:uncharacterized protein YehS (DUF1456 family)